MSEEKITKQDLRKAFLEYKKLHEEFKEATDKLAAQRKRLLTISENLNIRKFVVDTYAIYVDGTDIHYRETEVL